MSDDLAPEVAERHRNALELRLAGATYEAIANQLGYAGGGAAYHAVKSALDRRLGDAAPNTVATELARLDAMLTGLWPKARRGDVQAIDRVLRIQERRMALLAISGQVDEKPKGTPVDDLRARRDARRSAATAG